MISYTVCAIIIILVLVLIWIISTRESFYTYPATTAGNLPYATEPVWSYFYPNTASLRKGNYLSHLHHMNNMVEEYTSGPGKKDIKNWKKFVDRMEKLRKEYKRTRDPELLKKYQDGMYNLITQMSQTMIRFSNMRRQLSSLAVRSTALLLGNRDAFNAVIQQGLQ